MARASIFTLLSLDRFASIIGLNPVHFSQGQGTNYFPKMNDCNDVYYQYDWQSGSNVSRETIARSIKEAENDITRELGFSPAPVWIEDEVHNYPQYYRRDVYPTGLLNVRGQHKSIKAKLGKFIQGGRRAVSAVNTGVAVTLSDADGDGYNETATITTTTTLTDKCEIKVFFAGKSGAREWEIRPPRTVTLSGGTITFTFWAWQLLDPDNQDAFPTTPSGLSPIDIETAGNYVTTVDVYREYNDFSQASATFYWEPEPLGNIGIDNLGCGVCGGSGCVACSLTSQDGCIHVRDTDTGWVVPAPATYDSTNEQWDAANPSVCRDPDAVKLWYYAGDLSQDYLSDLTCDRLSQYWAEAITWLAVARTPRPFCGCNNSLTLLQEWQRDLSFTGSRSEGSFTVSAADLDNPFGTRLGEVKAWRRVVRMSEKAMEGFAV